MISDLRYQIHIVFSHTTKYILHLRSTLTADDLHTSPLFRKVGVTVLMKWNLVSSF